MPMTRFQIRNEYSLSDPELYRAADKDDPEALLEGVAMAGLVGVLRQLGDLAEFAAEIFHDLHEEVMVTAARGHDLMIRVQELEAEIPSIEREFLFQTDHSRFFYNPGVDWHPSFRENKNHVAYGDMPRFIMNSYEDCRGPPRLFLLDKYDIGGAGACLKRYTDPAFFKVETSRVSSDGLRNNKARQAKKRGANNDDTAVALMRPNPKLHQLFLEEPIVKSVNKPARVKLKRRLNGFPFDTKSGKSYMEKLFVTPIEHEVLHGVSRNSPLLLPTNGHTESDPRIHEVRSVSPVRKSIRRKKSIRHPDEAGTMQNELLNVKNDVPTDKIFQEHNSYTSLDESRETHIHVDGEREQGRNLIRMPLDITTEIDDPPAAPSALELEGKPDFEMQLKNDWTSREMSVPNHEKFYSRSSDPRATTSSVMYEEESSATRNSSFDSPSMKGTSVSGSFTEGKEVFSHEITDKGCSVDEVTESSVSSDSYLNSVTHDKNGHNAEQLNYVTLSHDPSYSLQHFDSEEVSSDDQSKGCTSNEVASVLEYNEKENGFILGSPSYKNRSSDMQLQVASRILNESNSVNSASASMVSEYNSVSSTSHSLHEDNYEQELLKPTKSPSFLSNTCSVLHQNMVDGEERIVSFNMVGCEFVDGIQECSVSVPDKYTETGFDVDSTQLVVCSGERQENISDSDGLSAVSASQECIMEASIPKDTMKSCSTQLETESNSSQDKQIGAEILPPVISGSLPYATENTYDGQEIHAVTGDNFLEAPGFEMNEASGSANMEIYSYSIRENVILPIEPAEFTENPVSIFADSGHHALVDDFSHPEMKHVESESEILGSSGRNHSDMSFTERENENAVATDISEFFCGETNFRNLGSVESPTILESNPAPVVENSPDHLDATSRIQSQQHYFFDKGQYPFLDSGQQSEIYIANPFCDNEGTVTQEGKRSSPSHREGMIPFSSRSLGPTLVLENIGNLVTDVPGFLKGTSNFISPFHEEDQITLDETPPMPPLPPFKWRMGKLSHFSVGSRELANDGRPLPTEISMPFPSRDGETSCSSPYAHDRNPQSRPSPVSQSSLFHTTFHHPPEIERTEQQQQLSFTVGGEGANQNEFLPPEISIPDTSSDASKEESVSQSSSISRSTSIQAIYLTPEEESKEQQYSSVVLREAVDQEESVPAEISLQASSSDATTSIEKISSSVNHPVPVTKFKEGNTEQNSSVETHLDRDNSPASSIDVRPVIEDSIPAAPSDGRPAIEHANSSEAQSISGTKLEEENAVLSSSTVEVDLTHTHPRSDNESRNPSEDVVDEIKNEEGGVADEIPKIKLPRPRNPLINAVSALDRSKLRKVVRDERAQAPKMTERDSLLEQIRTKSFNLKPATGSRPRVEAPRTNLRVAAILEKANAIRQALTGSDDDEDENWSDS